ncbi:DUF3726 domain-containing protein [Shewanella marina]|uniref:DUF3726 domain-containing protein n=1 Tax=Shewanella marina TaxID=487319 RepID=UPI000A010543|nr:DUF3726 domain-containing protein [Shewanella marina]
MIWVSHNELITVTSKAFDGLRLPCGEAEQIAHMVADLEMVGLHGIEHFLNAVEYLTKANTQACQLTMQTESILEVDLHGDSILCQLPTILTYVAEKLLTQNHLTLKISQCHNRWLAFGELCQLAKQGISIKAYWYNINSPTYIKYILNSGNKLPELYISPIDELALVSSRSLTIEFNNSVFKLPESGEYLQHISSAVLEQQQVSSWQRGIPVQEASWQQLQQISKAILVQDSSQ